MRRVLVVAGKGREQTKVEERIRGEEERVEEVTVCDGGRGTWRWDEGEKNDNHRHFNNMQRYSRLPRRASVATMALYNDKDTPGRLGTFRSTKGAALGSSYRTGTCFVRRGQMSPIMSWRTGGERGGVKITVGTKNIVGVWNRGKKLCRWKKDVWSMDLISVDGWYSSIMEIGRKFLLLRELIDEYIVNYIYRAVISRRITKIRSCV